MSGTLPPAQTDTPAPVQAVPTSGLPDDVRARVMAQAQQQQAIQPNTAPTQALPTTPAQPQQAQPQQAQPQQAQPQQAQPQQAQPQQAQPQQGQQQAVPTTVATSDPGQQQRPDRPIIDPRPYASLAENAPQYRQMVDQVADETGVSPQRLAWHWYKEGGFHTQAPDGAAGEQGPLQVIPSTAQQVDPKGVLNPHDLHDSLTLAGRYINTLDSRFGKDSPSSVGAYQGGVGSAADIAAHPDRAMQDHPRTMAYAQSAFPGQSVTPGHFTGPMDMDAKTLANSANQGPEGFLRYVAQTAQQSGTTMTDAMRAAEATLVGFAASRGDIAGMQHARDFVLQVAHAGSTQNLMAAHQALTAGDGQSASQYLAKAHAYFPDGSMGQFGVDSKGQVWGQRMDENAKGKPLSPYFKVNADDVLGMMNQTSDPGKYMAMVQEQQKNAASIRHSNAMGDYYGNLLDARQKVAETQVAGRQGVAETNADARTDAAQIRSDGTVDAATVRAGRQGQGPAAKMSAQADKEAAANFNDITMPDADEATRGKMAETYHDVRMGGVTEPQALAVTKGIHSGKLALVRGQDGRYGVMDPQDKSMQPIAILSQALGDRLAGSQGVKNTGGALPGRGAQAAPASTVGSGASSQVARVAGVSNDLSGTVQPQQPPQQPPQSSALPVSQ